jgi:hypothetical protein
MSSILLAELGHAVNNVFFRCDASVSRRQPFPVPSLIRRFIDKKTDDYKHYTDLNAWAMTHGILE